jgi:hypothetical protein
MKPFIGVIAKGTSGKSTIIKALTGCGRSNYRGFLKDNLTGETILIICGSPQEEALLFAKLRELLKRAAADPNCRGAVMAIQPTRPRKRLSMETIFGEVRDCGGFEVSTFIINPDRKGDRTDLEAITARLCKLGLKFETLDGRRFARINADIINDATSLIPVQSRHQEKAAVAATGRK